MPVAQEPVVVTAIGVITKGGVQMAQEPVVITTIGVWACKASGRPLTCGPKHGGVYGEEGTGKLPPGSVAGGPPRPRGAHDIVLVVC